MPVLAEIALSPVGLSAAFLFRLDIERDGRRQSYASVDVMTFDENGRIASMVAYPDRSADPGPSPGV